MNINVKRVYEPYTRTDGYRVLVDRLWPRGIKKEDAYADEWLKEVAPSTALRKWFNHEPEKWEQFVARYQKELKGSTAFEQLISLAKEHPIITLLYAAKDEHHNQAIALRKYMLHHQ